VKGGPQGPPFFSPAPPTKAIEQPLLGKGEPRAAYTAFTEGAPRKKMPFNGTHLLENLSGALSFRDGAARAKALEGDRREAIALYEKLLRPDISLKWTAPLEPRYHVELARLHRALGQRAKASRHCPKSSVALVRRRSRFARARGSGKVPRRFLSGLELEETPQNLFLPQRRRDTARRSPFGCGFAALRDESACWGTFFGIGDGDAALALQ